jgi:uncharacterized circularly permuted ATP-grasp superfamily protein/uncharacterized alpha-E superfamily protein
MGESRSGFVVKQSQSQSSAPSRYDEMRVAEVVQPHWRRLIESLAHMPPQDYARRLASAQSMIRENGVTYNVYDDAAGKARPWQLDIVPFVLGAEDWKAIEAAVIQRAHLANAILADVYGPQRLIAEGHMPPHLVLGHPQFLRPLMGARPKSGVHVHLYSVDLARTPDGSWMVLSSRTDVPSGLGYALENRIVVSQSFPDLFAEMHVQRLAAFFHAYREAVQNLSGEGRAVLLTPGPYNESYFEHAYLSHYLGLSLVEGQDLAVRDGQVFLKTLAGLERVSAIFRRLDSDYCDPLEFRADSALGVPGLVEAARAGGVVLANALGGGVVESPAMDAYLPNASRALFGEELLIPDIPTVWCGTEWGRKEALARLDRVVVRDAFDARPLFSRRSSAKLGSEMMADVARFAERLERRGATFVVQDQAPLGLAPVYDNGRLGMRPMSLRVFAAWTPSGYVVMPGGLARIASGETARALSMQSGAASKDVWVLADGPVDNFTLLRGSDPVAIRRMGDEAPSRAMDNLFWLGRYAERTENLVRVLRAVVLRLGDDMGMTQAAGAAELSRRLLVPFAQASEEAVEEAAGGDDARLAGELQGAIFGNDPQGLRRLLQRVEQSAWAVRDRLSLDTWRTITALTTPDNPPPEAPPAEDEEFDAAGARSHLDTLVRRTAALSGLSAEDMTRGANWLFLDLGRRVERASHVAWLVRQTLSLQEERDAAQIHLALEIADSAMTYRYRYLNRFQMAPVLDLLLFDESNPRAAAFQLSRIAHHVERLPKATLVQRREFPKSIVLEARDVLAGSDPVLLAQADATGKRQSLTSLCEAVDEAMNRFSDATADAYFQHAARRRAGAARKGA